MYSVHKYKTAVRNTAVPDCRKSLFFQKKCLFSIPNPKPLPRGKGLSVGLPPSPRLGLRPKPHFQKYRDFLTDWTAVRNTAVLGCRKSLFLKQTSKQLQSPTIVGSVKPSNRTSPFFEGGHGCPKLNAQSFAGRKTNRAFIKRQGCWRFATFCETGKAFIKRQGW